MKILLALLCMACSHILFAQDTVSIVNPSTGKIEKYINVDQLPEAGYNINKYIADHIKYPKSVVKGTVVVSFLVKADGTITNVNVTKSLQAAQDAEALRVVKGMPAWQPAKFQHKAVPSNYTLPVKF